MRCGYGDVGGKGMPSLEEGVGRDEPAKGVEILQRSLWADEYKEERKKEEEKVTVY